MFTTLQHNGLTDVVAVVSRYFGGIKLGAGGLVRAYSDAVAQAIEAIGTREVRLMRLLRIAVEHAQAGQLENQLRCLSLPAGAKVAVLEVNWLEQTEITVGVDFTLLDQFDGALQSLSAGKIAASPIGERWVG